MQSVSGFEPLQEFQQLKVTIFSCYGPFGQNTIVQLDPYSDRRFPKLETNPVGFQSCIPNEDQFIHSLNRFGIILLNICSNLGYFFDANFCVEHRRF